MIAVTIAWARARLTEYGHRRTAGLPRSDDSAVGPIALITSVIGFLQSRLTHSRHTEKSPCVSNTIAIVQKINHRRRRVQTALPHASSAAESVTKHADIERSTFLHTGRTATIGLTRRKDKQRSLTDNDIWFAADHYYDILGVHRTATMGEIDAAYDARRR